MVVLVRMDGDSAEDELRSLHDWLRNEGDVRRTTRMSLESAPPRPGEMGGALAAIQVVTGLGFQAAGLAISYASWRATRAKKPTVTIEHDGLSISLNGDDPEDVRRIIELLDDRDRPPLDEGNTPR